jgi:uncharacterized protein RhaS with RHS repeats
VRTEHYNYFRDYDPAIGRYVESDPIGLKAGLNTFNYADQNALSRLDAMGLKVMVCSGRPRTYLHSWICVNGQCGGLLPGKDWLGGIGHVGAEDEKARKSVCMEYRPSKCDQRKFEECVDKNVRGFGPTSKNYNLITRNCFDWSDDVLKSCEAAACGK